MGLELINGTWGFRKSVYTPRCTNRAMAIPVNSIRRHTIIGRRSSPPPDPTVHIVNGNKKDNFWMMGDTGLCGAQRTAHRPPPEGDTKGSLVNADSGQCIEIWNPLSFNTTPMKTVSRHWHKYVDTMGFERVAAIIQTTQNFTNFSKPVSNYDTDVFSPIFAELEKLSGKRYTSTLPTTNPTNRNRSTSHFA